MVHKTNSFFPNRAPYLYSKKYSTCSLAQHYKQYIGPSVNVKKIYAAGVRAYSNNLIISKLALLQAFYALYWPVNATKNCFVRFIV